MAPLYGEFNLRLDDKARLALPKDVRAQTAASGSSALVARGGWDMESAVWLFPELYFESVRGERKDSKELGFDLSIFELAVATRLEFDKRGRVTMPERLLRHYGILTPEVTLIGVQDHFELWSRTAWREQRSSQITKAKVEKQR